MDNYKYIEALLDKYWMGETELEEEQALRDFFTQAQVLPAYLQQYQPLFIYQQEASEVKLPDDFEAKLLAEMATTPAPRTSYLAPRTPRPAPFFLKIAAAILILITAGFFGYQHKKTQEQRAARETVIAAIGMIADNLQQGEMMIDEGLKQLEILFKQ